MKSEFLLAITQLSAEKNLSKEVILGAVETALASAYRKDNFAPNQNISVKINSNTGRVEVWAEKTVAERPEDTRREISLEKARAIKADVSIGDTVMVEATPHNAGRIAAQTAKQVILQRLHEAEHSAVFEEYANKEGDIISGIVQRIEPKQVLVNLGRAEAVLPGNEQVPHERYRMGQRLKVYLLEVAQTSKGPRLVISRSHPNLVKRLFELEVPEVYSGAVEIKSIAREAGFRSKVAVTARQEGIDPVGCCVGLRGIRIQNIVSELSGEKLDIVLWDPDPATFIANALSPARVSNVRLNVDDQAATVVVPDRQLSLAIGKEGQNVRLAAKLTGWRIDIKSASEAEAVRAAGKPLVEEAEPLEEERPVAEAIEVGTVQKIEPPPAVLAEAVPIEVIVPEEAAEEEQGVEPEAEAAPEGEPLPAISIEEFVPSRPSAGKSSLRFAEDIFNAPRHGARARPKKKKKVFESKEGTDGAGRQRKSSKETEVVLEEDEG